MRFSLFIFLVLFIFSSSPPVLAAEADGVAERIVRPMVAIDSVTLRGEGVTVRLWGIKPAHSSETALELKALDVLDRLIGGEAVSCKIAGGVAPEITARCMSHANEDLALTLLSYGYAVVDRATTYDTPFADAYAEAQELARFGERGVWRLVSASERHSVMPKWLEPYLEVLVPVSLVVGPFGGLLIVALVMFFWLRNMTVSQQREMDHTRRREAALQARERHVLVSTLEGELIENKNKVEAFLIIYGDMLRALKEATDTPKYQQAGDIVQKHPSLSRTVFDANVNKLSLLDIKLAGLVSKLYTSFPKEQEYINLEPTTPLETAIQLLEKVLREAEGLLPHIDQAIQGLEAAAVKKPA